MIFIQDSCCQNNCKYTKIKVCSDCFNIYNKCIICNSKIIKVVYYPSHFSIGLKWPIDINIFIINKFISNLLVSYIIYILIQVVYLSYYVIDMI